jgi:hypothetical protein
VFQTVCKQLNIPIAIEDPKYEKAYSHTTAGVDLGVYFISTNLSWKLPIHKHEATVVLEFFNREACTLQQFQKLHGKLNDFAQVYPFMKGFCFQQISFLQCWKNTSPGMKKTIPPLLEQELYAPMGHMPPVCCDGFLYPHSGHTPPF